MSKQCHSKNFKAADATSALLQLDKQLIKHLKFVIAGGQKSQTYQLAFFYIYTLCSIQSLLLVYLSGTFVHAVRE